MMPRDYTPYRGEYGTYEMELFCCHPNHYHIAGPPLGPHAKYQGKDREACRNQAKEDGWVWQNYTGDKHVVCPKCRRRKAWEPGTFKTIGKSGGREGAYVPF
jgi:hypothetical protein